MWIINCSICKPKEMSPFVRCVSVYVYWRLCICLLKIAKGSPRGLGWWRELSHLCPWHNQNETSAWQTELFSVQGNVWLHNKHKLRILRKPYCCHWNEWMLKKHPNPPSAMKQPLLFTCPPQVWVWENKEHKKCYKWCLIHRWKVLRFLQCSEQYHHLWRAVQQIPLSAAFAVLGVGHSRADGSTVNSKNMKPEPFGFKYYLCPLITLMHILFTFL